MKLKDIKPGMIFRLNEKLIAPFYGVVKEIGNPEPDYSPPNNFILIHDEFMILEFKNIVHEHITTTYAKILCIGKEVMGWIYLADFQGKKLIDSKAFEAWEQVL